MHDGEAFLSSRHLEDEKDQVDEETAFQVESSDCRGPEWGRWCGCS